MTDDEKEECFKVVDAMLLEYAESRLADVLPVWQRHRSLWRLLERGQIELVSDDNDTFDIKICADLALA